LCCLAACSASVDFADEAAINLVQNISLFDRPEQGIANLKVDKGLRKNWRLMRLMQKTTSSQRLGRSPTNGYSMPAASSARLARMRIDRALVYLNTRHTEPQWPEFVKMLTLTSVTEQEAEAKFKAAEAKAKKLGGPQKLTREDIDGLSSEQIKQLRGY